MNDGIDQDALNLAKAIRQRESKGKYGITGGSGEKGGFQFTPDTWNAVAPKYGINVPIEQATPEQQNAVAYNRIKAWKDAGYDVTQIASMWNAGEGEPNAFKGTFEKNTPTHKAGDPSRGTNQYGQSYDVPGYAGDVADLYLQFKNGQNVEPGYNPKPFSSGAVTLTPATTPKPAQPTAEKPFSFMPDYSALGPELGAKLGKRAGEIATGGKQIMEAIGKGDVVGAGGGLLHIGGAGAGALGDVVGTSLEAIPVVGPGIQTAEKYLGKGLQAVAETPSGQDLIKSFQQFSQENPRVAQAIADTVNIISAVPILRGLGMAKAAIGDVGVATFKKTVEKQGEQEIRAALTKKAEQVVAGAEKRGTDPVKKIVQNPDFLPESVQTPSGRYVYDSRKAYSNVGKSLDADESRLQGMLSGAKQPVSLNQAEQDVLKDIASKYTGSGQYKPAIDATKRYFDSVRESFGGRDDISLQELNALKRDVRTNVNYGEGVSRGFKSEMNYNMGQSFMRQVETYAEKAGIQGVRDLNRVMSEKLSMQDILKALHKKGITVKKGMSREALATSGGIIGEAVGGLFKVPGAGALAGRAIAPRLARKTIRKTALGKLTTYKSPKESAKSAAKRLTTGLVSQNLAQKLQPTQQQ